MSATPDSTLVNPEQLIANLQRQLAESRAERDEAQRQLAERTIERDEALAQQTATAEVLQVINSSPGDLGPVFDAMLEKALRLCDASFGAVYARNDERFERVASRGLPAEYLAAVPSVAGPFPPGSLWERILGGESLISIPDRAEPEVNPPHSPLRDAGPRRRSPQLHCGGPAQRRATARVNRGIPS